ncbi:MAG: peptidase M3, partial [Bacteroidales bacterium]|nr:peptidase M3 [Bacteroidales bacterium]
MRKITLIAGCALLMLATGCKEKNTAMQNDNPFIAGFDTPYNIPDFEKIKTEHYMPAFEEGMKRQKEEIDAIVKNPEAPTFENTIEAFEYSGELLNTVSGVFFNLTECENSPEMEAIAEEVTPLLSAHGDDIALNAKLFARIKAVYDQRESLQLNPEQMRLLEETYKGFVRGGANVPEDKQPRFRELNERIASLTLRFAQNVLKATNAYSKKLDDGTEVTLQLPSWEPFMQTCPDRKLREEVWHAYTDRCNGGEFDNTQIIIDIVNTRLALAKLFGKDCYADKSLHKSMAENKENVYRLLDQLRDNYMPSAREEVKELQEFAKQ